MTDRRFQPWRHPWVTLLLWVSVTAALNVPSSFVFIRPEIAGRPSTGNNSTILASDAAKAGWPDTTPVPWPAPEIRSTYRSFGVTLLNVTAKGARPDKNGFQMNTELYGWPFPVLRRTQRWWDWEDPTLVPPGFQNHELTATGMAIHWTGLTINPLIIAIPLWGITVLPPMIRRRSRRKRRLCEECGYPMGSSHQCSECGSPLTTRTVVERSGG